VSHRVDFLDVFTDRALTGNGLAVVHEADGLDDEVMLAFARETRLAETTFVQAATEDGADYRTRIFTIDSELPFAGHPSLGTAVAVALARGESEASYVQQTGAGLQPIEVRTGGVPHASMLQEPPEFRDEIDPTAAMAAVGLAAGDAHPMLRPQVVSTGLPTAVVPVAEEASVSRAAPDLAAIDQLLGPEDTNFYLAWWDADGGRARARMFTRLVMGGEDPATGSAAGPLCAYLAEHAGAGAVTIRQGEEMGRPSVLETSMEDGRPRVGGSVVPLIQGTVELPRGDTGGNGSA
jgi:trans-2,3-dihydro-3-hydroxyanthranilate isomerase